MDRVATRRIRETRSKPWHCVQQRALSKLAAPNDSGADQRRAFAIEEACQKARRDHAATERFSRGPSQHKPMEEGARRAHGGGGRIVVDRRAERSTSQSDRRAA